MISAEESLLELRRGNRRFVTGGVNAATTFDWAHWADTGSLQSPLAIVLACSDSRVPVQHLFDQGSGALFIVRVAGNIVTPSELGSIEYAATQFGTPLVLVLGHTDCGAVATTLNELRGTEQHRSPNLRTIIDQIRPAAAPLLEVPGYDAEALLCDAVRANIRASVEKLSQGSEILERLVDKGKLMIAGAEYSLATGEVVFFDRDLP